MEGANYGERMEGANYGGVGPEPTDSNEVTSKHVKLEASLAAVVDDNDEADEHSSQHKEGSNFGTPFSKLLGQQELEVIDANIMVQIPGRAKSSRRRKPVGWSVQDDKLLVVSFLNISKDPILGDDKKLEFYWSRMAQYFNENRKEDQPQREPNQCKQHWHTINKALGRFKECYSKYDDKDGYNEAMKMANALQAFDNLYGRFTYQHVWHMVKDEPKWKDEYKRKQANMSGSSKRAKVLESRAYTSSGGDAGTSEKAEEVEPISQRASENLKTMQVKNKNIHNDYSESISQLQSEQGRSSLINHITLVRELQVKEEELENQLLFADVSKMTSLQRKIHEKKLEAIAEKYGWDLDDN